ncbi:MAG: prolyl oligopeptidase family serine peptidase [Planctomycetota bacterium]
MRFRYLFCVVVALQLACCWGLFAAEPPATIRHLPPAGIDPAELAEQLEPADRQAWEEVPGRLATLRRRLTAQTLADEALRAETEVFLKAVEWALAGDEWWDASNLKQAAWALDQAAERMDQLQAGHAPWREYTGLIPLGFRSRLDGSLQPYGLWVPEGLPVGRPVPVWIWLHGRGDKETDLAFLHGRAHKAPEFQPVDAVVLLPFGRYCNGWKGPGMSDVFEALAAAGKVRAIDPERIVLAGFSMGGAGAWNIGARRTDRFCAIHGGAGFVDTKRYLGIDPASVPLHESLLWNTTDVLPVARNLLNLPAIAYSGELDRQRAASEIMVETLAAEGRVLPHVIGAGMPHKYDEVSKRRICDFLARAQAAGRPRDPETVAMATTTLADSRLQWVEALGLAEHFQPARIDASRQKERMVVTTHNVTALALHDLPPQTCVTIDGSELPAAATAETTITLAREGLAPAGGWRRVAAEELPARRKRPGLTGPIDDAFTAPFIVVGPTGPGLNPAVDAFARGELAHFQARWHDLFRGALPLVPAGEVTEEMLRTKHLVLFGDPQSNPLIARVLPGLPLEWNATILTIGVRGAPVASGPAASHVPVMIQPNPLASPTARDPGRYVVLNSGITFREDDDVSNARQTPKLPDWAAVDITEAADGRRPGRIVAAGFCDEFWRIVAP